jgi:hypothetical protein
MHQKWQPTRAQIALKMMWRALKGSTHQKRQPARRTNGTDGNSVEGDAKGAKGENSLEMATGTDANSVEGDLEGAKGQHVELETASGVDADGIDGDADVGACSA